MTVPGHRLTRLVYIILSLSNRINYGTWRFTYTSMILVHSHEIKSNYMYNQIKSCLNIVAIHHRTWVIGLFDLDCCRHGNVFHLSDQCCMCSAMVSTYTCSYPHYCSTCQMLNVASMSGIDVLKVYFHV